MEQGYQDRVMDEKASLDIKIRALNDFINKRSLMDVSALSANQLHRQLDVMHEYSGILNERINCF